jgi:hypothetical protein
LLKLSSTPRKCLGEQIERAAAIANVIDDDVAAGSFERRELVVGEPAGLLIAALGGQQYRHVRIETSAELRGSGLGPRIRRDDANDVVPDWHYEVSRHERARDTYMV